jgi:hypothetical protein
MKLIPWPACKSNNILDQPLFFWTLYIYYYLGFFLDLWQEREREREKRNRQRKSRRRYKEFTSEAKRIEKMIKQIDQREG